MHKNILVDDKARILSWKIVLKRYIISTDPSNTPNEQCKWRTTPQLWHPFPTTQKNKKVTETQHISIRLLNQSWNNSIPRFRYHPQVLNIQLPFFIHCRWIYQAFLKSYEDTNIRSTPFSAIPSVLRLQLTLPRKTTIIIVIPSRHNPMSTPIRFIGTQSSSFMQRLSKATLQSLPIPWKGHRVIRCFDHNLFVELFDVNRSHAVSYGTFSHSGVPHFFPHIVIMAWHQSIHHL